MKANSFKIGIKYCGGCNPKYNRKEEVSKLIEAFKDEYIFENISLDSIYHSIIVVCGCENRCVNSEQLSSFIANCKDKVFLLSSIRDFEKVFTELRNCSNAT